MFFFSFTGTLPVTAPVFLPSVPLKQFLLAKFPAMESLLAALVQVPKVETVRSMEQTILNCISLKHILEHVEPLRLLLAKSTDTLLGTYASVRTVAT